MWYDALEIARFIIAECFKRNINISNLKLQKMLYFLWVDFFKRTGRMLFFDEFYAWQLGPVIPNVYYEYCSYAGRPIVEYYNTNVSVEDQAILDSLVKQYASIPASQLVNMTHRKGSAWDTVFRDGAGNRNVIPFDLIIQKEAG